MVGALTLPLVSCTGSCAWIVAPLANVNVTSTTCAGNSCWLSPTRVIVGPSELNPILTELSAGTVIGSLVAAELLADPLAEGDALAPELADALADEELADVPGVVALDELAAPDAPAALLALPELDAAEPLSALPEPDADAEPDKLRTALEALVEVTETSLSGAVPLFTITNCRFALEPLS